MQKNVLIIITLISAFYFSSFLNASQAHAQTRSSSRISSPMNNNKSPVASHKFSLQHITTCTHEKCSNLARISTFENLYATCSKYMQEEEIKQHRERIKDFYTDIENPQTSLQYTACNTTLEYFKHLMDEGKEAQIRWMLEIFRRFGIYSESILANISIFFPKDWQEYKAKQFHPYRDCPPPNHKAIDSIERKAQELMTEYNNSTRYTYHLESSNESTIKIRKRKCDDRDEIDMQNSSPAKKARTNDEITRDQICTLITDFLGTNVITRRTNIFNEIKRAIASLPLTTIDDTYAAVIGHLDEGLRHTIYKSRSLQRNINEAFAQRRASA